MPSEPPQTAERDFRGFGEILVVAVLYFVTARLGLLLAMPGGHVTPVWPPSGIALAAMLICGRRVWPGIWLGSFVVNLLDFYGSPQGMGTALAVSAVLGLGASVTALAGFALIRRFVGEGNPLQRVRDVCAFLALGGMISCLVSATLGVSTLCLAGYAPWENFGRIWETWWLGDTAGVFVMAPLLLVWAEVGRVPSVWRVIEFAGCLGLLVGVAYFVFIGNTSALPVAFILIPVLVWPSIRFGQRGAVLAVLVIAVLAVWGTINQMGPFAIGQRNEALLLLELFLSMVVLTSLCIAAMVAERDHARMAQQQLMDELEKRVAQRTAALAVSEEKFRAYIEQAADALFVHDCSGRFIDVNSQACRSGGYNREELLQMSVLDLVTGIDRAQVEALWNRAKLGEILTVTGSHRRKDGSSFPVEVRWGSFDRGGERKFIGLVRDITERQQAEAARRVSDLALKAISQGVIITGPDARIISANQAFEEITGYHVDDVLGRSCKFLQGSGSDPAMVAEIGRAVLKQEKFSGEILNYRKDGTPYWNDLSISPVHDAQGVLTHFIGITRDITGRKKAEEALAGNEARLNEAQRIAHLGSWQLDLASNQVMWSDELYKMYGADPALPPPSYTESQKLFTPESWARLSGAIERTRVTGQSYELELETVRKDGRRGWMMACGEAVRDASGATVGLRGVAHDITDRKQAELALQAVEGQLRQSQKLEAIGTLAGGIAHDFNNILAGITGFASLARTAAPGNAELLEYLREISHAGNRAAELVKQIMAFSRAGDQAQAPILWHPIVAEAVKLLRAAIPSTIEIESRLPATLPVVMGNGTQLHQVLMNLGTNAAYAMRQRAGRLTIALDLCEVTEAQVHVLSELKPGPCVRLTVSDTGEGMSRATQERIFEPFFTTKGPGEGSGLGLSVVHGIVRSHAGAIRLTSEPDRGSRFEIYLPALAGAARAEVVEAEEMPRGQGERILFVDDERALVKAGALTLGQLGYSVEGETDVQAALARLQRAPQSYQLVITDQTMPGMTGLEFAERIRSFRSDLPIILVSGFSQAIPRERRQAFGALEILGKPYSLVKLAQVVRRHLSRG